MYLVNVSRFQSEGKKNHEVLTDRCMYKLDRKIRERVPRKIRRLRHELRYGISSDIGRKSLIKL